MFSYKNSTSWSGLYLSEHHFCALFISMFWYPIFFSVSLVILFYTANSKKSKSDCTFIQDEKEKDFQVKICTTDSSKRFGIAIFKVLWKYESVRNWQEMMLPKKTSHSVPWRRRWHKMMMKINMQKGL